MPHEHTDLLRTEAVPKPRAEVSGTASFVFARTGLFRFVFGFQGAGGGVLTGGRYLVQGPGVRIVSLQVIQLVGITHPVFFRSGTICRILCKFAVDMSEDRAAFV